jgi:phenylacetate-coenzyme A ligase PaaK-like adenylate-forming protein
LFATWGLSRSDLRAFTLDTRDRHPEGLPTRLSAVVSYSQYLTRHWRAILTETWGCPIIDRYRLAELFGGATQCLECGWWHFNPFLIPEVATESVAPMEEGVGLLLLTTLYPFQEAQPMVRYATGDLVEATHGRSCHRLHLPREPGPRIREGLPAAPGWQQTCRK